MSNIYEKRNHYQEYLNNKGVSLKGHINLNKVINFIDSNKKRPNSNLKNNAN
jgi:hypothetical protein